MVKGISAVDAIYGSTKTAKGGIKKAVQAIKDNKVEIMAAGGLAAGVGLYGAAFNHYVNGDKADLNPVYESELAEKQSFFNKISERIKEKFSIDLSNPPAGIDPTEPYMRDGAGHYIMDEYGAIPNPWYNPDAVNQGIDAISTSQLNPVTMDSFLKHAMAKGSADKLDTITDIPFSGDPMEVDDNMLEAAAKGIKTILDNIVDII